MLPNVSPFLCPNSRYFPKFTFPIASSLYAMLGFTSYMAEKNLQMGSGEFRAAGGSAGLMRAPPTGQVRASTGQVQCYAMLCWPTTGPKPNQRPFTDATCTHHCSLNQNQQEPTPIRLSIIFQPLLFYFLLTNTF